MDISSAIVGAAMEMRTEQFAAQYSVGVMKAQMDFMEDISSELISQLAQVDVGPAEMHAVDILA